MTVQLTDEQVAAIRNGCEGVTPGPWVFAEENAGLMSDHGYVLLHGKPGAGGWEQNLFISVGCSYNAAKALGSGAPEANAAHIARCDPDTIRAITSELLEARAEIERMREALLFYADGAPVCENDEAGGGIRTSGCKHQRCEFPECAKPQFPTWDNGGRARAALKGEQP